MRIKTKLILLLLIFSLSIIIIAGIFTNLSLKNYIYNRFITDLAILTDQIEYLLTTHPRDKINSYEYFQKYAHTAKIRLTLIGIDGKVIFESEVPDSQLTKIENHFYRKEIQNAYNKGFGTDTRKSTTINVDMLYFAKAIKDPLPDSCIFKDTKFIRIAVPLTYVQEAASDIKNKVMIASISVFIIISLITIYISNKISKPIQEMGKIALEVREGNIEKRIPVRSSDEIGKLAETINAMLDKLHEDINKLKKLETIRSEFLGNVSHELRTPIFAVQGMLETLLHGALDDPEVSKDFINRALANTQRLNTLLNDLIANLIILFVILRPSALFPFTVHSVP